MSRKKRNSSSRIETAHHEAGHAVAAFVLDINFDKAHIIQDPAGAFLGRMSKEPETFVADSVEPVRLEHRLIVNLAGMAAEARYTGNADWRFGLDDFNWVFDVIGNLSRLADDDLPAYMEYLWQRAQNLLRRPGHWEGVQNVAEELLRKGELTYAEVDSIVRPGDSELESATRWLDSPIIYPRTKAV
jgi:hypothetical protein